MQNHKPATSAQATPEEGTSITKLCLLRRKISFRTYAKLNRNAHFRTVQTPTIIGPVRFQTAPTAYHYRPGAVPNRTYSGSA